MEVIDIVTREIKKVVLAYSGGLDTSVILKWLVETYGCEVIAFAADIGQKEELDGLEDKAMTTGASKIYIEDLQEEFVRDFVSLPCVPMRSMKAPTCSVPP
jgi:argininosuccinate synthase